MAQRPQNEIVPIGVSTRIHEGKVHLVSKPHMRVNINIGTTQSGSADSTKALAMRDLHALVVDLQTQVTVLQKENSNLRQEIHQVSKNEMTVNVVLEMFTIYFR
jgi:uncharacterized protein YlxW (UPF0749 family)